MIKFSVSFITASMYIYYVKVRTSRNLGFKFFCIWGDRFFVGIFKAAFVVLDEVIIFSPLVGTANFFECDKGHENTEIKKKFQSVKKVS